MKVKVQNMFPNYAKYRKSSRNPRPEKLRFFLLAGANIIIKSDYSYYKEIDFIDKELSRCKT